MTKLLSLYRGVVDRRQIDCRSMAEILADVAARYGVATEVLLGDSRKRMFVVPRQEAMTEMYATGRFSLPQIGHFLGGRDHTTVLHGLRAHRARAPADDRKCRITSGMASEAES